MNDPRYLFGEEAATKTSRTEQQAFIAMLVRVGIGHGLRNDSDGSTAVMVEHAEGEDDTPWETQWAFDANGQLYEVTHYVADLG